MINNFIFSLILNLVLIITTVQAALPQSEFGPKIQALQENIHTTCITKSGTDENTINTVVSGVFPDEPKIKVYAKCILDQINAIDQKGAINGEIIADILPDQIKVEGSRITNICIDKTKDIANLEDKAFAFFKCIHEQNSDLFIFF